MKTQHFMTNRLRKPLNKITFRTVKLHWNFGPKTNVKTTFEHIEDVLKWDPLVGLVKMASECPIPLVFTLSHTHPIHTCAKKDCPSQTSTNDKSFVVGHIQILRRGQRAWHGPVPSTTPAQVCYFSCCCCKYYYYYYYYYCCCCCFAFALPSLCLCFALVFPLFFIVVSVLFLCLPFPFQREGIPEAIRAIKGYIRDYIRSYESAI